jgi:pimeloyl-ACP methyl ester carboxylesterase
LIQSFDALTTRDDVSLVLGAIKWPALVLHGTEDETIPWTKGQALARGLAKGQFAKIQGAGHASCLTYPDLVNPLILSFLQQLPAAADAPASAAPAAEAQTGKEPGGFWQRRT